MENKEITARSDSPLTHYVDIVLEQIELLDDARRGVSPIEGVTDICGLLARFGDDHKRLGRLALQEMRDDQATDKERELLLDSIDKHAICLETAYQNTQGYIARDIKDEACGKSVAAVGELRYLTKPAEKASAGGQGSRDCRDQRLGYDDVTTSR